MKKTSIKRKILIMVLGLSVISLTAFCAAAITGFLAIRTQMQQSSEKLGDFATAKSSELLEREALDKLASRAKSQSQIINERLRKIAERTVYFSEYATGIYRNADNLTPMAIPYPSSANAGVLTMQLQSAGGTADYPVIQQEAELLGNLTPAFLSSKNEMDLTSAIFVGTESGFAIIYNTFSNSTHHVYDPRTRPWYIGAKRTQGIHWSDPYIDAFSGKLTVTCSYPFYDDNGKFMGVVGADVIFEDLNDEIVNIYIGENGYAFVINSEGTLISSKDIKQNDDGSYEEKKAYKEGNDAYNEIIYHMIQGNSGVETVGGEDGGNYIAYSQIPAARWSVAMVLPVSEVLAAARQNSAAIQAQTDETLKFVNEAIRIIIIVFALVFALAAAALVYFSGRLSQRITGPIITLDEQLGHIAMGELDTFIDIRTGDEIERLGDSVNSMTLELKDYIKNIQSITAEKERIGAELDVATKIQASMLPCIFPAFPERAEFDIYASMQPAKEVGGDFYDFFLMDENTLAVVMADVSGKGVPAALFMVIAKTLIKNNAQYGKSPKEVFETVNNLLYENNEAGMFVTAFLGYLDIPSGRFTFVNAGHNPPLLRSGDSYNWLKTKAGFVLAGMEDMFYKQHEITLNPGDELFMYTDGITEAVNNENELFGDPRLLETVNKHLNVPLRELAISLKREIDRFAEGAEQADDITMLALRYKRGNQNE